MEYNILKFEDMYIRYLKDKLNFNQIYSSYPEKELKKNFVVTTMNESPNSYSFGKNELSTRLTFVTNIFANSKVELIRLRQDIEKLLLECGFTRVTPSEIVQLDNKFFQSQQFIIKFNKLSNKFERSI